MLSWSNNMLSVIIFLIISKTLHPLSRKKKQRKEKKKHLILLHFYSHLRSGFICGRPQVNTKIKLKDLKNASNNMIDPTMQNLNSDFKPHYNCDKVLTLNFSPLSGFLMKCFSRKFSYLLELFFPLLLSSFRKFTKLCIEGILRHDFPKSWGSLPINQNCDKFPLTSPLTLVSQYPQYFVMLIMSSWYFNSK